MVILKKILDFYINSSLHVALSAFSLVLMTQYFFDVYGDYIRYTHSSCHSYVVMSIDGKILVVNGENDSATKEIYHTISEKVSNELK